MSYVDLCQQNQLLFCHYKFGPPLNFLFPRSIYRTGITSIETLRTYERLDEVQHKAVSTMLSNAPGSTRTMTYSQHLMTSKTDYSLNMPSASMTPYMPSVNLHDLHGCTINLTIQFHNPNQLLNQQ